MESTTLAERLEILESTENGEPVWRLARRMPWRARTIRKWRQRGRKAGRAGLVSQMGRPPSGALGSFPPTVGETVRRWRQENPGWGAKTLHAELERHAALMGQKIPSRATLGRFLAETDLIAPKEPSVSLPDDEGREPGHPHQVWEMDGRGYEKIPDVGVVSLIHLNDRFSHVRLLSYPCWLGHDRAQRHPTSEDYQTTLRIAFMEWGRPQTLQVDHESVFYDNKSRSPFPTRLHLWVVALGISLTFIRYHQPKEQGMSERSHQLWYAQVIQGHTFADWSSLYEALQKRRSFLNRHLPCRSLNELPPLVAYPDATHSGSPYRLEYEADLFDPQRVYAYLARGRWFRQVSRNGTVSLGGYIYYIGTQWYQHQTEITFDPDTRRLLCVDESGCLIKSLPIKGLSQEALMGDLADLTRFPSFQLALPFSWHEQQLARLYESLS